MRELEVCCSSEKVYLARGYWSNIVEIANQIVQKWNFEWFNLTKEELKTKIAEI